MTHNLQVSGCDTTKRALFPCISLCVLGVFGFLVLGWSCASPSTSQEVTVDGSEPVIQDTASESSTISESGVTNPDGGSQDHTSHPETPVPTDVDLNMKAEDFGCILRWTKVNRYRITNKLGFEEQALKVARSSEGGTFPVGTIIQLVPQEAMVKRQKDWNPKTNDWEFFFLKVDKSGTTIETRGKEDVKNGFGGNCFGCHAKAAPQWDLICGDSHGCDPLPLSPSVIESLQQSDPRCP